jgi:hypothetical protein
MGLQEAYNAEVEAIRTGQLSHPNAAKCGCRGGGWFLTDFDTWEECPDHRGRPHPEDYRGEPWLYIDIENADGSPYDGVITYDPDGDRVFNDGPVYRLPENHRNSLRGARARAREWQNHVNKLFPERNLKVRLHREWR